MSRAVVTVNGTPRPIKMGSLSVNLVANSLSRITCEFDDAVGSWRPAMDDDIVVSKSAVNLFGGRLNNLPEASPFSPGEPSLPIATKVSGNSYDKYLDQNHVNETVVTGTLKSFMIKFLPYLQACDPGVTISGAQVNGPVLPERPYTYVKLRDAVDELTVLSNGYVSKIDENKVWSMALPGTMPAPFDIIDGDDHAIGDVRPSPTRNQFYANRVIVPLTPTTQLNYHDTFTAGVAQSTFQLTLTGTLTFHGTVQVTTGGSTVWETLGTVPAHWLWDLAAKTITRVIPGTTTPDPPAAGATVKVVYDGVLTGQGFAEDAGEIAAHGLFQYVKTDITSDLTPALAQAIATEELARRKILQKLVVYDTYQTGAFPGMTQLIQVAARNLNGTGIIQEITIKDQGLDSGDLLYTVSILLGALLQPTWQATVKQWAQVLPAGAQPSVMAGAGGGPALPDWSVQFRHPLGVFGGSQDFLEDLRGFLGGGPEYGEETAPARVAITTSDENAGSTGPVLQLAIANRTAGIDKALTFWIIDDGELFMEHTSATLAPDGIGWQFIEWNGAIAIDGNPGVYIKTDGHTSHAFITLTGRTTLQATAYYVASGVGTTSFTIDSGFTSGAAPQGLFRLVASSPQTVTLPSLAFAEDGVTAFYHRRYEFVNVGTANWTIQRAGSDTIFNGLTSITLAPGQSVTLQATHFEWTILSALGSITGSGGGVVGGSFPVLTADPSSPSDDTYWVVRTGTTPTMTLALKARIAGVTETISSATL